MDRQIRKRKYVLGVECVRHWQHAGSLARLDLKTDGRRGLQLP